MSLRNSPELTPELVAAARRNGQRSAGPRSESRGDPCDRPGQARGLPLPRGWLLECYSEKTKERTGNVIENKGSLKNPITAMRG